MAFPLSVRQEREDPKFDGKKAAFCVCKGSMQSLLTWDTKHSYYPLAAKVATISLSNFRGSHLGFDAFCKKLHKQDSSQSGDYRKHVNCRMTRSFRSVQPIVAKVLNIDYKRMSARMKAIATNLISQPKHQEILLMVAVAIATNILPGLWQDRAHNFSSHWFTVFTIGASFLGQALGLMAEKYRLRAIDATPPPPTKAFVGGYDLTGDVAMIIFLFKIMLVIYVNTYLTISKI